MSGCYDYNECGYEQTYEYNDYCCKPRHHRRRRQYNDCWDYSSSYCS